VAIIAIDSRIKKDTFHKMYILLIPLVL